MLNWISIQLNKVYYRIYPPLLFVGDYWWVKNVYGDLMKVLIKHEDSNIVVVKNMTDPRYTPIGSSTETSCFIHDIRWIRPASVSSNE